jgi:hypothetical protein
MKYLTFLDYTTLEARDKSIEAKSSEKAKKMEAMKQKYELDMRAIRKETNQRFNQIMVIIQHSPKLTQIKPEALLNENFSQ